MLHPDAAYWDKGVRNVPDMTGAKHLLDARDLRAVCGALGLTLPLGSVVDVGCGTGRLSQLCANYWGFDVAPSAVEYCHARGITATLITGPDFHVSGPVDLIACISVFTHIDRAERQRYLSAFRRLHVGRPSWHLAPRLLVDIIPGNGSGNVALWTADPAEFEADLAAAGYTGAKSVDQAWDQHIHRYYYAEVA